MKKTLIAVVVAASTTLFVSIATAQENVQLPSASSVDQSLASDQLQDATIQASDVNNNPFNNPPNHSSQLQGVADSIRVNRRQVNSQEDPSQIFTTSDIPATEVKVPIQSF